MIRISPAPEKVLTESDLLNLYPWPNKPWIRANMVQTLDGGVTDQNQETSALSTAADKQIFRHLRQLSDVILIGTKTAQSSPYLDIKINEHNQELRKRLRLTKKPRLAIVSNELNFTKAWLKSRVDEAQPIIYTSLSNEGATRQFVGLAEFVFCGQKSVDLKSVKQDLVRRSFKRILCEGGPTLLHSLLDADLIDELDLSVVAQFAQATEKTSLIKGAAFKTPIYFKPFHVLQENQTIFIRYLTEGHKF